MKKIRKIILVLILFFTIVLPPFLFMSCSSNHSATSGSENILFLHHSTGDRIWRGNTSNLIVKLRYKILNESSVSHWFNKYNRQHNTNFLIQDLFFPRKKPYGWKNYPYDYYNIWVKHAGNRPYLEEPTLEMLTKKYNVIIWKHCFPVSDILPDDSISDVNSEKKTLGNYKLQYKALKEKMHEFPHTKFIVWTGATLVKNVTTMDKAQRAKEFFDWVRHSWDEPGDNIFIWDFYQLETDGGLYMKDEYASGTKDSHPNPSFSAKVYPLFCQRIVDIIETGGKKTTLTGEFR